MANIYLPYLTLSEREITILSGALRVAREQYLKDAATSKEAGTPRIEQSFLAQATDCDKLIERLDRLDV